VICSVIKHLKEPADIVLREPADGTQTSGMDPYGLTVWPQRGVTRWGTRAIRDKRSRGTAEAVPAIGGLLNATSARYAWPQSCWMTFPSHRR
jgi:hypothetical protein